MISAKINVPINKIKLMFTYCTCGCKCLILIDGMIVDRQTCKDDHDGGWKKADPPR